MEKSTIVKVWLLALVVTVALTAAHKVSQSGQTSVVDLNASPSKGLNCFAAMEKLSTKPEGVAKK